MFLYALNQDVNSQEYEDLQSKYCHSLGLVFLLATASLAKCYLWLGSPSSWGLNCSHSFIPKAPCTLAQGRLFAGGQLTWTHQFPLQYELKILCT